MSKLEDVTKILKKAASLSKGKELGLAKELIALDDKLEDIKEKTELVIEEQKNRSNEYITEALGYPEFPTEIEVSNFPDIQKVEVTNYPKVKAPIVNVKAPEVNVEAPIINIDTETIEDELKYSNQTLKEISKKLTKGKKDIIDKVILVDESGKFMKFPQFIDGINPYGGSFVPPSIVGLKNAGTQQINPATEETLQSIAGLNIPKHDTRELGYTDGNLTTVIYKLSGTIVATKTLSYTDGNLSSVVVS